MSAKRLVIKRCEPNEKVPWGNALRAWAWTDVETPDATLLRRTTTESAMAPRPIIGAEWGFKYVLVMEFDGPEFNELGEVAP